jgi:hypothetical protein
LIASPPRASGIPTRNYKLSIEAKSGFIHVREKSEAPLLPTFCPQRHLNSDGTFCLGLNAGSILSDSKKTRDWWKKLHVFLSCQDTASETRTWPVDLEISHGTAGVTEVQAENLAEELGLLDDYRQAVRGDNGIIAFTAKRVDKSSGALRNGRARCLCGRTGKKGYPKLRRECRANGDQCIVLLEAKRRAEEKQFWNGLKGKVSCCGTMDSCPLK